MGMPVVLLVLFFAWVLAQMGAQAPTSALGPLLIGTVVVLVGGGLVFLLLSRVDSGDD